ncbi:MAG TPA: hypothetical protein VM692_05520 [Gammaproteobacteria bacterium]|nr:hypothetical protein [Gammaproteobacteria bacterium]
MTNELPVATQSPNWQREATIALAAIGFGLLILPFAVYVVGSELIGVYDPDGGGALDLAETIWLDLLSLRLPAWVLVLSPYITVQLARWVRRVWRPKTL